MFHTKRFIPASAVTFRVSSSAPLEKLVMTPPRWSMISRVSPPSGFSFR